MNNIFFLQVFWEFSKDLYSLFRDLTLIIHIMDIEIKQASKNGAKLS